MELPIFQNGGNVSWFQTKSLRFPQPLFQFWSAWFFSENHIILMTPYIWSDLAFCLLWHWINLTSLASLPTKEKQQQNSIVQRHVHLLNTQTEKQDKNEVRFSQTPSNFKVALDDMDWDAIAVHSTSEDDLWHGRQTSGHSKCGVIWYGYGSHRYIGFCLVNTQIVPFGNHV